MAARQAHQGEGVEDENEVRSDLTEDDQKSYKEAAEDGFHALLDKIQRDLDNWKNIKVKYAVIGETGAGKSSFINAMLGLSADDEGSAEVDCLQSTMTSNKYEHPKRQSLSFWDLPGAGTTEFPMKTYLRQVEFETFDVFIMVTHGSLKENELRLIQEIEKTEKALYLVRTKIDSDILNDKNAHPKSHNPKTFQDRLRTNLLRELAKAEVKTTDFFLVNNYWRNDTTVPPESYDFEKLWNRLIEDIPKHKRETLIFSFSNASSNMIETKVEALKSRATKVAITASLGSLVPIPGVGFACEIGAILHEVSHYKDQLETDEQSLQRIANKMGISLEKLCQMSAISTHVIYAGASASRRFIISRCAALAASEVAQSGVKFALPFIGNIISAAASIPMCKYTLHCLVEECKEEAFRVRKEFEKWSIEKTSSAI